MMRYQRVSPDCLGPPNGRKPTIRPFNTTDSVADPFRVRSGSVSGGSTIQNRTQTHQDNYDSLPSENPKSQDNHHVVGGDVLLQWGHKKRSRGSRAENRAATDESSVHCRSHIKIQRRAAIAGAEKIAAVAAASAMAPPCGGVYARGANLRACVPLHNNSSRTVEERSNGQQQPERRSPPSPPPHKTHHHNSNKASAPASTAAANGFGHEAASTSMDPDSNRPSDQETVGSGSGGRSAMAEKEKVNLEQFEWPRIYISLSRKEKEDDFWAMKGTKLPQRPKKRAKNVDKSLQYCFPGMWLSDLNRGRYEVREKKCVKKKRRGLKGMESMDSDSE